MRWVYIGAGLLALSASCYMAVIASGGLSSPSAPGLIAMAVVPAVGAAAIGTALAGGHTGIAVVIGLGMLAGEGGSMLQTAQRVTAAREAMRAPIAAQVLKRQAAVDELAKVETVKPAPIDRSRVDAALNAKAEAEKAVREKSAEAGCRQNCRLLLQSGVDAAQREVEAARDDVARQEADKAAASAKRIEVAKAAVAALPPPQSATPLADYTGVPEWLFDVIEALTISFAINLPASTLVALGVKMGRPRLQIQEAIDRTITIEATTWGAEREPEALQPRRRREFLGARTVRQLRRYCPHPWIFVANCLLLLLGNRRARRGLGAWRSPRPRRGGEVLRSVLCADLHARHQDPRRAS
jgi:hypothetical protein